MMYYNDSKTKAKHRKRMVKNATSLFIKNGISETTVTDICALSEIERQTFYNYFENKDEIAQYAYVLTLEEFYSDEMSDDHYQECKTGFEKVEKYFRIITDRYFKFYLGTVFLVHYDYYFQKEPDLKLVSSIYEKYDVVDPLNYFLEGINDGSIEFKNDNPNEYFYILTQSFGAYANRIIFRTHKKSQRELHEQKKKLKIMIDSQLNAFRADKKDPFLHKDSVINVEYKN